jgi:maltose-binding protein MalE
MSPRKILFFVITGILVLSIIIGMIILSNKQKVVKEIPKSLRIWITDWTSESYKDIIAGFKKYAPEYANTDIVVEKKTTDPVLYRTLLLSTIADENGPDIFMLSSGEDAVLSTKIEPIPSSAITIGNFEKQYEDIFMPLIFSTGAAWKMEKYIWWVPLWYESLGMFYNKSLIRDVPKTWNDLDTLYTNGIGNGVYPTNLGLGPRYTPNIADILWVSFIQKWINSYEKIQSDESIMRAYLQYADENTSWQTTDDIYSSSVSLKNQKESMDQEKTTTYDMFVRWDISLILGYPSIVWELEKAVKRANGKDVKWLILSERIPQNSPEKPQNIARYQYFWLSKLSKNGYAWAKFLEYLMTDEAERIFISANPTLIPAKRSFYDSVKDNSLSSVFPRIKLDTFIPNAGDTLSVFDYGFKKEFEKFLDEYIDRNDNMDMNNISSLLSQEISCTIGTYQWTTVSDTCNKKSAQ